MLQVLIVGNDVGNPNNPATNTATVTVTVQRNDNPPRFISAPYGGVITRAATNGSLVTTAQWTDDDLVVSNEIQ